MREEKIYHDRNFFQKTFSAIILQFGVLFTCCGVKSYVLMVKKFNCAHQKNNKQLKVNIFLYFAIFMSFFYWCNWLNTFLISRGLLKM